MTNDFQLSESIFNITCYALRARLAKRTLRRRETEVRGSLAKRLGFGAVEDEKGEGRRPQRLRTLAPNIVKRIFSYKDSRTRSVRQ